MYRHLGLPIKDALCAGDIGAPLFGIIDWQRHENEWLVGTDVIDNHFRKLEHGNFDRVSDVYHQGIFFANSGYSGHRSINVD
jgi:hypothetical protein